jgi:hypothetical protein
LRGTRGRGRGRWRKDKRSGGWGVVKLSAKRGRRSRGRSGKVEGGSGSGSCFLDLFSKTLFEGFLDTREELGKAGGVLGLRLALLDKHLRVPGEEIPERELRVGLLDVVQHA